MIWSAAIDKEELLSFGQGEHLSSFEVEHQSSLSELSQAVRRGKYVLVWGEQPTRNQIPRAVILRQEDVADFFSFTSTYLRHLSPITAQMRVFDEQSLRRVLIEDERGFSDRLAEAAVGVVICEAAGYLDGSNEPVRYRTCAATHTFALARYAVRACDLSFLDEVSRAWQSSRRLCGEQKVRFSPSELMVPWTVLRFLASGKRPTPARVPEEVLIACSSLLAGEDVMNWFEARESVLPKVPAGFTREEKVQAFDRYAHGLLEKGPPSGDATLVAFGLGLLCSEISLGSLDHLPLLSGVASLYPAALLWYGVCAGLRRQNSVFSFNQGLGRLVFRELSREWSPLDVPSCDIALSELEILSRGSGRFPDIQTASASYADIELSPGVTCSFSISNRKENGTKRTVQTEVSRHDKLGLSRRLGVVIQALESLQDELLEPAEPFLPFDKKGSKPRRR